MQLADMLARSLGFETRAAALYRRWAAAARDEPKACTLWTALARDEEAHARALAVAKADMPTIRGWRVRLDGWDAGLANVDEQLQAAERLPPDASLDAQLRAALALELTEIDALRLVLMELAGGKTGHEGPDTHACHLADVATSLSSDPDVALQASLVRLRARMHTAD